MAAIGYLCKDGRMSQDGGHCRGLIKAPGSTTWEAGCEGSFAECQELLSQLPAGRQAKILGRGQVVPVVAKGGQGRLSGSSSSKGDAALWAEAARQFKLLRIDLRLDRCERAAQRLVKLAHDVRVERTRLLQHYHSIACQGVPL
jgi:hypothetical protein